MKRESSVLEHVLIYLFTICITSLMWYTVFGPFIKNQIVFLLSFKGSLYILVNSYLLDDYFVNIF